MPSQKASEVRQLLDDLLYSILTYSTIIQCLSLFHVHVNSVNSILRIFYFIFIRLCGNQFPVLYVYSIVRLSYSTCIQFYRSSQVFYSSPFMSIVVSMPGKQSTLIMIRSCYNKSIQLTDKGRIRPFYEKGTGYQSATCMYVHGHAHTL